MRGGAWGLVGAVRGWRGDEKGAVMRSVGDEKGAVMAGRENKSNDLAFAAATAISLASLHGTDRVDGS